MTNDLLLECLEKMSIKEVSEKLNVSKSTVKRWVDLRNTPNQYLFDITKILNKEIDYSLFSSSDKDQFFTQSHIVEKCWDTFIRETNLILDDYIFIEPSAGDGAFVTVLPENSIFLDIEPRSEKILRADYLDWEPGSKDKKYIVFGNPPFGLRGHMALKFINHSFKFADYVCFILPQLFESDGKGNPKNRVKGFNLIHSENVSDFFRSPENKQIKINCVFQIWSKEENNKKYEDKYVQDPRIKIFSLSDGGSSSSTRNKEMIGKCDVYLPSTCFGKEKMKCYKSFEDLPGKKGYGILFLEDKKELIKKAESIDWTLSSFQSTNSAYNLRTSLISKSF